MDDDRTSPETQGPDTQVRLDSEQLRALAHPLRLRLLGALRLYGPDTSTGLARQLDTNSGQTSYHLRKLAEAGLIEDDPDHSTARDRYWRACHTGTSWSSHEFRDDPDDWAADTLLMGQLARLHARWVDEALAARDGWDEAWLSASDMSDLQLWLTPQTTRAMVQDLHEVLGRYRAAQEHDDPAAEHVTVLISAFPHADRSV